MESYLQGQEQPFGVWINDHGESVVSYMVINWVYQKLNPMTKGGGICLIWKPKLKKFHQDINTFMELGAKIHGYPPRVASKFWSSRVIGSQIPSNLECINRLLLGHAKRVQAASFISIISHLFPLPILFETLCY